MTAKPTSAAGYNRSQIDLVKATCLYVATKLGDLLGDLVVVGGLAPSLLIPHEKLPANTEPHVGTLDLDLGLTLALLADKRYQKMSERLRRAGFEPDVNEVGNKTRQRWRLADQADMKVDFLIPQSESNKHGGTIQNIDKDLAALITPGLELAFKDFEKVLLTGKTVRGEEASREIKVCGPGAYVILKTLAFRSRGENKDAYDLYYVVRNFGVSTDDVAARLRPLLDNVNAQEAMDILKEDFSLETGVGPIRVAEFISGTKIPSIQADVAGFILQLLKKCDTPRL